VPAPAATQDAQEKAATAALSLSALIHPLHEGGDVDREDWEDRHSTGRQQRSADFAQRCLGNDVEPTVVTVMEAHHSAS
jgi:hypothetical protein